MKSPNNNFPLMLEQIPLTVLMAFIVLVGEVEDALALQPGEFEAKYGAKKPSKEDTNIVFHCRAGVRSLSALQSAHQMGYSR